MKNIFISGGTGFIGSNFIKKYHKDYNFYCLVRGSSDVTEIRNYVKYLIKPSSFTKQHGDLPFLDKLDCFINLATYYVSDHKSSDISKLIRTNIELPSIIIEKLIAFNCKKIINIGSVWQNFNNERFNPYNFYASTKESFENILRFYFEENSVDVINLKLSDTYGENDKRNKILNLIKEKGKNGESIDLTDGNQIMDIVHIEDIVHGINMALEKILNNNSPSFQTFRLGNDTGYTLKQIIKKYVKSKKLNVVLNWNKATLKKKRIISRHINIDPVLPGWKVKKSII